MKDLRRAARTVASLVAMVLLSGLLLRASPLQTKPMPEILRLGTVPNAYPTWVSAARVLTPAGDLDETLFPPDRINGLKVFLGLREVGGCVQVPPPIRDKVVFTGPSGKSLTPDRSSFDSAFRSSEMVLRGLVTGRSYGLAEGTPGQLLRLRPLAIYKDRIRAQSEYYVFVPVGTFKIASKTFCKTDPAFALPPDVGEEALVLVETGMRLDESYLPIDDTGLITLRKDGKVEVPAAFGSSSVPWLSSPTRLLSHVAELARERS
jgi:hypothetical protein